jgi:hypothetical protein
VFGRLRLMWGEAFGKTGREEAAREGEREGADERRVRRELYGEPGSRRFVDVDRTEGGAR